MISIKALLDHDDIGPIKMVGYILSEFPESCTSDSVSGY